MLQFLTFVKHAENLWRAKIKSTRELSYFKQNFRSGTCV